MGWNLDTSYWTNRDLAYPRYVEYAARMAYDMAGIKEPRKEINIAEPYDPFDYKAVLEELRSEDELSEDSRYSLAVKAFSRKLIHRINF